MNFLSSAMDFAGKAINCKEAAEACINIIDTIRDAINGTENQACQSLYSRCKLFEGPLKKLQDGTQNPTNTGLVRLQKALEETLDFVDQCKNSTGAILSKCSFLKSHADDLARLNSHINECAIDFLVVELVDSKWSQREEFKYLRELFEKGIKAQNDEMNERWEYSQQTLEQIQEDIEENYKYMLSRFDECDIERIKRDNERLKLESEGNYQRIMTELTLINKNINEMKLDQEIIKKLISSTRLNTDEINTRTTNLSKLRLSRDSVTMESILARGGFGEVFRGRLNGSQVAIKKFLVTEKLSDQEFRTKLENELLIMRYIDSCPTIVTFYGYIQDLTDGMMIVMELSRYGALSDLLRDQDHFPAFPFALSLSWMCDLARALTHIHGKNIKHRDIKADNLLVFDRFHLKLCDFGLAKEHSLSNTTNNMKGTIGFLAPEAILGKQTNLASDIFAAAMTGVQILGRKHPKIGDVHTQISDAIEHAKTCQAKILPQPTWLKPVDKDNELQELLKQCVEYDMNTPPEHLRPTAGQLLAKLTEILDANGGDIRDCSNYIKPWLDVAESLTDKPNQITDKPNQIMDQPNQNATRTGENKRKRPQRPERPERTQKNNFLCSSALSEIKVWDLATGTCEKTLTGHKSWINALCELLDGSLCSASADGTIKVWDIATGECEMTLTGNHGHVLSLCVLPDGRLCSGSHGNTIKIWDMNYGECEMSLVGHSGHINTLCTLPDGRICSGSGDRSLKVWNTTTGNCDNTLIEQCNGVLSLCALPNNRLCSGLYISTIMIWDLTSATCIMTLEGHTNSVLSVCLLSNGLLCSGSSDYTVKVWNITSGTCENTLQGVSCSTDSLCALPDGRLCTPSWDKSIKIWNVISGEVEMELKGHTQPILTICYCFQ